MFLTALTSGVTVETWAYSPNEKVANGGHVKALLVAVQTPEAARPCPGLCHKIPTEATMCLSHLFFFLPSIRHLGLYAPKMYDVQKEKKI